MEKFPFQKGQYLLGKVQNNIPKYVKLRKTRTKSNTVTFEEIIKALLK